MELLKHLVVSENGDSETSGSSGNDATRSDDLIKEDNSFSEDTGGVGRNQDTMSREAMTEANDVGNRNNVPPESDKCNGLENVGGKKTKKTLKYKAMEDTDPSEQRLKINLNNSVETVSSNGLNDSKTKRKKKRVKSKPPQCKTESYIDPLELKYLELNDILVRDYIERKRPVRYVTPCRQKDSVGGLYEQYVAMHGRPPPVPGLAKAITRPYNQTTPSKITISVKRHSHQPENESDEPISNKLSCNSQNDVKFHRPVSANVVRPSRSRRKDTGNEKQSPLRRSRSAGSGRLNRRKTRSTNSLQSDLVSGGRTDTDTSTISSPGRQEPTDCHLKDTRNESIQEWLERKNKLLKQEMKLRRQKKRQERLEQMDKAVALYERSVLSEKETQKWMLRKRREVWLKNKEDELMKDLQNKAAREDKEIPTTQLKSSIRSPRDNPKARSVSFQDERLGDEIERRASKNKETEPGSETPLLYKRAVRGKIRFQMPKMNKTRTTRPSPVEREQNKAEKKKEMRVSYDQWLLKKRNEVLENRRAQESKTPENKLRQSDPTCEILRQEGRRRVRRVLKGKQQLDTGIVHENEEQGETNNSGYRPKSAKFRERPKPSSKSPVRINRRLENAMANDKKSNPFVLPFPPEHGVPRHVAAKQREIFADKVWKAAEEHPPVSDHEDDGAADGDVERQSRKDEGETESSSSTVTTAEDVGEQSPRYGFNRSKSPVSSSSNENSAPNRTRLSDDGITVDSTENSEHVPDSIFLTSLELP